MPVSGKYVSLETVLEKLYRDYPFRDISFSDAIEWAGEAIAFLGVVNQFVNREVTKEMVDGRAELPCDLYILQGIKDSHNHAPLLPKSSIFPLSSTTEKTDDTDVAYTYVLQGSYVFTERESIDISYKAFPTDDKGVPVIADREPVIRGVVAYIANKLAKKLFYMQLMNERIYAEIVRNTEFDMAAAESDGNMMDMAEAQAFKHGYARMMSQWQSYDTLHEFLVERERLHK